ncbi:MAG TPA: DegT/DnrJ/EryC1/StrS family aminotransferase [Nitrospira sp.]|nr:DegT/DnrJ/EryC1/StrS family aminotransferase [Nitrospira sp.]
MKVQRTLAPTAAPIPIRNLVRAPLGVLCGRSYRDRLIRELKKQFSAQGVFLVSSGKAALTLILKALAAKSTRRRVVIPAYTCFSVPSAIVKAGLEVVSCDVEPATLDFRFDELESVLDERVLCVLPTHLFGFAADVGRVKRLCREKGIAVVEDAAQAMGAQSDTGPIGTAGDAAFFSLGRGKNLTAGSGGIILSHSPVLTESIEAEYCRVPEPSSGDMLRNWIELVLMSWFIHPSLYWFPAGLRFLGLGETKFYTDFPVLRMDGVRAGLMRGWVERLAEANRNRAACAGRLIAALELPQQGAKSVSGKSGVYLRLPVLMADRKAKEMVCNLSREYGAGVSPNYPATIQDIPELVGRIAVRACPGAQEVVERLVTLPTHRFVKQQDVRKLREIIVGNRDATWIPLPA